MALVSQHAPEGGARADKESRLVAWPDSTAGGLCQTPRIEPQCKSGRSSVGVHAPECGVAHGGGTCRKKGTIALLICTSSVFNIPTLILPTNTPTVTLFSIIGHSRTHTLVAVGCRILSTASPSCIGRAVSWSFYARLLIAICSDPASESSDFFFVAFKPIAHCQRIRRNTACKGAGENELLHGRIPSASRCTL